MKMIICTLIIFLGLVFLGLTQRYEFNGDYRIDKLTGQKEMCSRTKCIVIVKGTGIFKTGWN
jgi:hypothetical protein